MAVLIRSADVFDEAITSIEEHHTLVTPSGRNIGSLPTLFDCNGFFVSVVNSYFFHLKAISKLKDLSSYSRALLKYWSFLEDNNLQWDIFPPVKRLKPTYLFRSFLLTKIQEDRLSQSTANIYINHIKNFYLWAMHENYLQIRNDREAPFKIERITIQNSGPLAHLNPTICIDSSDLRIKVVKNSQSQNVRSLSPLSRESLILLSQHFCYVSEELKLQCLLAAQCGLRIQEVSTLTVNALKAATPLTESKHRYELPIGPSTGVATKYGKSRHIEISFELFTALESYVIGERRLKRLNKLYKKLRNIKAGELTLSEEKRKSFENCNKFEPLFISEQGNPVDKKSVGARWTELRKLIRKQNPTFRHNFHDLRATYGSYRLYDLLNAGVEPVEALELLMDWMGHNHEQTTWKYLRYLKRKEVFREKFALLDSIMHEILVGKNND